MNSKTLAMAAAAGLWLAACNKPPAAPPAPPEVAVGAVVQRDVPVYLELVGQTLGSEDVEVRARVEGYVQRVAFAEGSFVRRGDLLYVVDPKPYEAALSGATADLAAARARLEKAKNDVARYTPLAAIQAVSRQELDNAVAAEQAETAHVEAGRAAVDKAKLDLGYTRVLSPVEGLAGTTRVKEGALVGRGENTLLTTVSTLDPILFRAGLAEAEYLRLRQQLERTGAAANLKNIPVELLVADGTRYQHTGHMELAERAVDTSTGTLMVQFRFANPQRLLRPGQYGRARMVVENRPGALLVPQRAVQEMQGLYSVAVVNQDGTVAFRRVKVGPRMDTLWVIEEGVKPDERVIVEGLQRVRDGMKVTVRDVSKQAAVPASEPR